MTESEEHLLDSSLRRVVDRIADGDTEVGSGGANAAVLAMAAGAVAMAAGRSRGAWDEAAGACGQANALKERAAALVQEGADAYSAAIDRIEGGPQDQRLEQRDFALGQALSRAADAPLAVAELAADVCALGAEVAANCDPSVRPDAVAGCVLGEASAVVGAQLVEVNLTTRGEDDERLRRARDAAERARSCRDRALGSA